MHNIRCTIVNKSNYYYVLPEVYSNVESSGIYGNLGALVTKQIQINFNLCQRSTKLDTGEMVRTDFNQQ